MRKTDDVSWVVYRMTLKGQPSGMNAVCEQGEWDDMEQDRPGYHTLVRAGIENECEAEKLARGALGTRSHGEPRRSPSARGRRLLLRIGSDTRQTRTGRWRRRVPGVRPLIGPAALGT